MFTILTNESNEETDYFEEVSLTKKRRKPHFLFMALFMNNF